MFEIIKKHGLQVLLLSISSIIIYQTTYYFYTLIRNRFIRKSLKGKTVLITDFSEIGSELAKTFLVHNFNIVLINSCKDLLAKKIKELEEFYAKNCQLKDEKTFIKGVVLDFNSNISTESLNTAFLAGEVDVRSIHILINNIFVNGEIKFFFEDENMENIINVNILNTLKFTKYILRNFMPVDSSEKKCIIFMGSIFGDYASPLMANFAASKAFILNFAKTLSYELETKNVNVEVIKTLFVKTESSFMGENLLCPSAAEFALSVFNTFGCRTVNAAYYIHILIYGFLYFIPEFIISAVIFTFGVLMIKGVNGEEIDVKKKDD
ncbi:Very-long-chain 3-oxoacyl-CoA reductase [Cucumispora dikerogammari]|nr:Very-long-chain 3-oxoacyl-CoA reductase [Cucumispora dikerogammari]